MAANDSKLQVVGTDFDEIKSNLITFLQDQNVLKDASYTGSVLSILMDLLAYNTHYNAYYLNMVANEMFLDTATKRSSLVSHVKNLGYIPYSYSCPTTTVNISISGVSSPSVVIPKYAKFLSEKIDGVNYTFISTKEYFINTDVTGTINVQDVILKQGTPATFRYTFGPNDDYNTKFKIPDSNVDLDTLEVVVQKSGTSFSTEVFTRFQDIAELSPTSKVFFVQESYDGNYEISFGNGVLGKSLTQGNIIIASYIITNGTIANGANNFVMIDSPVSSYSQISIVPKYSAISGREKESLDSMRYIAPRNYSAQGRAVTINDYVTIIKKNSNKFPIDVVNVWSGEDNDPPVYGKIFISLKPAYGYAITENQKTFIKEEIIKPISVITVQPEIVDVDYTFVKFETNVLIDKGKTLLSDSEIKTRIISDIQNYAANNLNSFESTLIIPNYISSINQLDPAIVTNDQKVYLQKRIYPKFSINDNYILDFNCPIKKSSYGKSISFQDSVQYRDPNYTDIIRQEVFLEEIPAITTTIDSITLLNHGYNYTDLPTVTILGDGVGATAVASILDGKITGITVTNPGRDYTQAVVTIQGGGGTLGSAKANLSGQYGILRTYYYVNGIKTVLQANIGLVDYLNGIIILSGFAPYDINNSSGTLSVNIIPDTNIITSTKNKLLTMDQNDPYAIKVNVSRK